MHITISNNDLAILVHDKDAYCNIGEKDGAKTFHFEHKELGHFTRISRNTGSVAIHESKGHYYNSTRVSGKNNEGDSDSDSIYLLINLGDVFKTNYKDYAFNKNTGNLWAHSDSNKNYLEYNANSIGHSFNIEINGNFLQKLANQYPDLFSALYYGHQRKSFVKWDKNDIPITNETQHILHQIQNAHLMGNFQTAYIDAKIVELLSLQLSYTGKQDALPDTICKNQSDIDKIHKARSILLENYINPPNIYELSRQIGINDFKLKKGFKEVFNQSVYAYVLDYKMELAYKLLTQTSKTIVEVALECGYDYPNYFAKAFKKKYGVNPGEFRKREREAGS